MAAANALNSENVIVTAPITTHVLRYSETDLSWLFNGLTDVNGW